MLKFLKGLFAPAADAPARGTSPSPGEPSPGGSPSALSPAREVDFRAWLDLLLRHLQPPERERLIDACVEAARQDIPAGEALLQGLMNQERGQWALMQVDWKASDEVEWQARDMASAHGLPETFAWDGSGPDAAVLQGLLAFDGWLQPQGKRFLFLDLEDDAFYGVVVPEAQEARVLDGARGLDVALKRSADFRRSQGEG